MLKETFLTKITELGFSCTDVEHGRFTGDDSIFITHISDPDDLPIVVASISLETRAIVYINHHYLPDIPEKIRVKLLSAINQFALTSIENREPKRRTRLRFADLETSNGKPQYLHYDRQAKTFFVSHLIPEGKRIINSFSDSQLDNLIPKPYSLVCIYESIIGGK